jgi:hypothetical protein
MTKTCGRKIEGIRCGRPTKGPNRPYCQECMREYQRIQNRQRRGKKADGVYGSKDCGILDKVWRQHAKRIRANKDIWDTLPVFNQHTLEIIDVR